MLLIEDEIAMVRLLELELNYEGYDVVVATDGLAGTDKALNEAFDLILMDLNLPGIDESKRASEYARRSERRLSC